MAVSLLGASDARVNFGALTSGIQVKTALSAAFTIRTAATLTGSDFFGQWGPDGVFSMVFLVYRDGNQINYAINGGAFQQYAFGTTDSPLATSTLLRVVCRWDASPLTTLYVNGVARTVADSFGTSPAETSNASLSPFAVGYRPDGGIDGVDGEYSEVAVWNEYVPDWVCEAYGKGMSPLCYPHGGVFYAPLWNTTSGLANLWKDDAGSSYAGTNTAGTDAGHPFVFYPSGLQYGSGPAANTVEVIPEVGQSFGPLVWVEWDGSDGTVRVWAPVDLPDPATYYHGYKSPRLLSAGRVVRALSDEQGEYQGQTFDVTVDDTARDLRTLLGASDGRRHFLNTRGVMRMISQDDWRAKRVPRTVAIGQARNYRLH